MNGNALSQMPDAARTWIYAAARPMTGDERARLGAHMDDFLREWRSHGRQIEPSWGLVHDQFLVIAVEEAAMALSGCSIDSMFRAVEDFSRLASVDISRSGNRVFYRDHDGRVRSVDRLEFSDLARTGAVGPDTIVFDNTVSSLGRFRLGGWELPLRDSWHMKAFGRALAAGTGVDRPG